MLSIAMDHCDYKQDLSTWEWSKYEVLYHLKRIEFVRSFLYMKLCSVIDWCNDPCDCSHISIDEELLEFENFEHDISWLVEMAEKTLGLLRSKAEEYKPIYFNINIVYLKKILTKNSFSETEIESITDLLSFHFSNLKIIILDLH